MGNVTVNFQQPLPEIIKINETSNVQIAKPVTFKELLKLLEKACGRDVSKAILEPGENSFQGHIILLVNGNRVNTVDAKIPEGSVVDILALTFGG